MTYNVITNDYPEAIYSLEEDNKGHTDHPGKEKPSEFLSDTLDEEEWAEDKDHAEEDHKGTAWLHSWFKILENIIRSEWIIL